MGKKYNERLRELREDHDYKQSYIASILKCATYSYQRYEYGDKLIPIDKLMILADFYNTSTDYILGLTDDKEPYQKE